MAIDENNLEDKQISNKDLRNIKLTQVKYFESYNGQVLVFIHKNLFVPSFQNKFDHLELALSDLDFHRINQKQIVNMHCVKEKISRSRSLILFDGTRLKVSRKCWYKIKNLVLIT